LDPAQALASMNRFVCDLERPTVATALLALLDTHRGIVTIASAGHQPPLLASRSRASFLSNAVGDLPLGVERTSVPTLTSARTPPATLLVLYTDGVIEHERQFLRGETQLRQAAMFAPRQSSRPIATLIADLTFKADGNNDDIAILAALMPSAPFPTAEVRGRGHSSKGATPLAMREWA
jgi:serine phosphatase RsbU (regulator of sigma subunit)